MKCKNNGRINKARLNGDNSKKKKYALLRWVVISSLLIQSGFMVNPLPSTDALDLVTDEIEQQESDWFSELVRTTSINDLISAEPELESDAEEMKDEDGFVYYDIELSQDIQRHIFNECQIHGVPYELAMAVCTIETGGTYNFKLRSKTNDSGLFQINDCHKQWVKESGITDLFDPYQNATVGIWILKDALSKGDGIHTSLMVYNMGYGGAKKLWKKGVYSSRYSRKVVETMDLLFR